MKTRYLAGLTIVATGLLAACGGGGSSGLGSPAVPGAPSAGATAQSLGVTFSGAGLPLSSLRRTASLAGTSVTVTYNGQTVATGTLNSAGFAELHFTSAVPLGATVTVTAGSGANAITATIVLASAIGATAANVVYTPANGSTPATITVHTAADRDGNGQIGSGDDEQETSVEDPSDGEFNDVNSTDDDHLPGNLPITISTCNGSTITIAPATISQHTPAPGASASPSAMSTPTGPLTLRIAEKVHDEDGSAMFTYVASPFTGPLTFPVFSSAARIDIEVDANGHRLVTIEAPIAAFTSAAAGTGAATPGTCPTLSPDLPFSTPTPTASPAPTPSASTSPTPTPSASTSPAPTPSAHAT
ncbi:MAG: hypothetical protein KGM44_09220 [bacterium]|nr:hypothetical protein [bacterium]